MAAVATGLDLGVPFTIMETNLTLEWVRVRVRVRVSRHGTKERDWDYVRKVGR